MKNQTKQSPPLYVSTIDTGHSEHSRRWCESMWRRYWRTLETPKGRRAHREAMQRIALQEARAERKAADTEAERELSRAMARIINRKFVRDVSAALDRDLDRPKKTCTVAA